MIHRFRHAKSSRAIDKFADTCYPSCHRRLPPLLLASAGVQQVDGITAYICIEDNPINQSARIAARPTSQPRRVVPHTTVVKSSLVVALFAGEAEALETHLRLVAAGLIGCISIGVVLLVRDDRARLIQLQAGGAE